MDRMKKALDKVKRSPATLDSYFKKYFEMDFERLMKFRGSFEEMMAARLTINIRDTQGCVNLEIEDPAFDELKSVIKSCVEKTKLKKKGRSNANTSAQGG
ncbi:MAG: hypothetical protein WCP55_24475 [Lentisphaerota bacterium]